MKLVTGIALGMLAVAGWAQSEKELTPRELFYIKAPAAPPSNTAPRKSTAVKPKPVEPEVKAPVTPHATETGSVSVSTPRPSQNPAPMVKVSYTPLALKYSILQRKGNQFEEVDADTEFHSGDRIRVRVESNATAYLYIVMGGSSGQWRVLFPSKDIAGGNNRVEAGQPCTIPPESDPAFYFDETAGVEKVSLVLSRTPEPDLEKLIYAVGDPTRTDEPEHRTILAMNSPIDNSVMGHVREQVLSRDLVFEKYDGTTPEGKQEKAVYAATRDKSANARLFVDLKLVHK